MATRQTVYCVLGLSLMSIGVAYAQNADFAWSVRAGAVYSDNVTRSVNNDLESIAAVAGIQVDGFRPNGRLRFDVSGLLDYYHYLEDSLDGELIGSARGQAVYDIVPEKLDWSLDGNFDQQRASIFFPAAPGNREDVLVMSTGPTWRAQFGDAFAAVVRARYADASYSEQSFDNNTSSLSATLEKKISALVALGLGGSFSELNYGASGSISIADVERREMFLTGRLVGSRTDFDFEAGYATLNDGAAENRDPVIRTRITRRLSPFLSARIDLSQQYPTTENTMASFAAVDSGGGVTVLSSSPRKQRTAAVALTYARSRSSLDLAFVSNRERGLLLAQNARTNRVFRAVYSRRLTPRSYVSVNGAYSEDAFQAVSVDETEIGTEFSFALGSKLSLDAQLQIRSWDSNFAARSGDDLSIGVFVRYGRANRRPFVNLPTR